LCCECCTRDKCPERREHCCELCDFYNTCWPNGMKRRTIPRTE